MTLRVGLVQLRTPAGQGAALAHAEPLIRQAVADGAQLVLTPEASNILQKDRAQLMPLLRTQEEDGFVLGVQALAADLSVWIDIGSALVLRPDGKAANRQLLVSPAGAIAAWYDKLHMFDVDLPTGESARESAVYEPGERAVTAHTPLATLGLTICYDMRFPALYWALARAGAEVITAPAAFTRPTGEAHWEILLRSRAIEAGAFVLAAAQGGFHEDRRGTWGHSIVVGPWGEVVARLDHDEPAVLMADLDLAAVGKARAAIPNLRNSRAFSGPDTPIPQSAS
jgi:predicted amidohydrolase